MSIDEKLLRTSCKTFLKEVAMLSDKFEKITNDDWRRLEGFINKMTTEDMMVLIYGELLQEKGFGKYAGLAVGGALAAKYLVKGKPHVGALGAGAAMGAYYLYKRYIDRCDKGNTPQEQASCRAAAAQRVIAQLKQNMKSCNDSATPENCALRIQGQLDKWTKIYSDQSVKAHGVGAKK